MAAINLTETPVTPTTLSSVGVQAIEWEGSTPPASPVHGQRWILDTGTGAIWELRYNAFSASAYKWEFVGGAPLFSRVDTQEATSSTSYAALVTAGPTVTLPRPGDYDVDIGAAIAGDNAQVQGWMSYDVGAVGAVDADGMTAWPAAAVQALGIDVYAQGMRRQRKLGLAAVALTSKYRTTTGNSFFIRRWMSVLPARIS